VLGGGAFFILTIFYLIIDEWNIWSGAPFQVVGMNSILLYILHEILKGKISKKRFNIESSKKTFKIESSEKSSK